MEDEFRLILSTLRNNISKGTSEHSDITFDYDYRNLFSPFRHGKKKNLKFVKVSTETARCILSNQTHWYRKLDQHSKYRLGRLIDTSNGRLKLKEYLHTVDGMLISLIFSVPELFLAQESCYKLADQVTNSILTLCLSGHYTMVLKDFKRLRKEVKYHSMTHSVHLMDFDYLRRYSWLVPVLKFFQDIRYRTSKSKMFRVAMFCQTRACGLASDEMCKESVVEFIRNVTKVKSYEPDDLLSECIEEVTEHLARELNYGTNPMFKMSASSAACFEASRAKGGKFEELRKQVIEEGLEVPEHLLYSAGGQLGTPLFQRALEKAITNDGIRDVNIAAVRENGKARVITSGSFWKDTLLQGFSHLTIEIIKSIKTLRDSVQAARHGWKFIQRLNHLDHIEGWPLFEEAFMYSFDWTKATDNPTHAMGRDVVGRLLRKINIPEYILEPVLDVWVGMKNLHYEGKLVGTLVNGIPMGDPLTKTCISLAHPIAKLYAEKKTASKSMGAGNGDDGQYIPSKREFATEFANAARMLGYEESPLDCLVTDDWGTYCEEFQYLPRDRFNTVAVGSRTNNVLALPYLDFPKTRLIIGTSRDRENFSSDIKGKVTLLGKDGEYTMNSPFGPYKDIFSIAYAFQDVCLGIIQDDIPLYLPRQVNGVGRPPGNWDVESWMNIFKHCRKWHRDYYLLAMRDYVRNESNVIGYKGVLKESVHFNGELRVETLTIPDNDPIKEQVELSVEEQKLFPAGVVDKLVSLKYLIPEEEISKLYLFNRRLRQLDADSYNVEDDLFAVIKEKTMTYDTSEDPRVWRDIVRKFVSLFRTEPWLLRTKRPSPLYRQGTLDLLRKGDPLRIDIDLEVFSKFKERLRPETPYERGGHALMSWYLDTKDLVISGEMYRMPPVDILADDPIIIHTLSNQKDFETFFFIVTDDVKLYRLACNRLPNMLIGRIPIRVWFACGLNEKAFHDEFETQFPGRDMEIIIDQGSIESYILIHDISFSAMGRWMLQDKNFDRGYRGIPWDSDIVKTKKMASQPQISKEEREPATPAEAKFPWFGYTNPGLLRNLRERGACIIRDRSRSQSAEPETPVRRA